MKQFEIIYHYLPEHIGGACTTNSDGSYLIIINNTLSKYRQHKALGHELAHICLGHLESSALVEDIEHQAESLAWDYYKAWKEGII